MLEKLSLDLELFVLERGWKPYHHPKSLSFALLVEVSELIEHFIPEKPLPLSVLEEEMGDVFNILLLFAKHLSLSTDLFEVSSSLSSTSQVLDVTRKAGLLSDYFLWMSEEESKACKKNPEIESLFASLFSSFLLLAHMLSIDPVKVGLNKLAYNKKKYPVDLMSGDLTSYRKRKKEWKKDSV